MTLSAQKALILASLSPRRRDLLRQSGLSLEVIPSRAEELILSGECPQQAVARLAEIKAQEVALRYKERFVIAADTMVVLPDESEKLPHFDLSKAEGRYKMLGKPLSDEEAAGMLRLLSGRTHLVISAFCIININSSLKVIRVVESAVKFRKLSEQEIEAYVRSGEPRDKAGAYAVQGIGAMFIERINGSYTNVVGLPLAEVIEELSKLGVWRAELIGSAQ